MSGDNGRYVGPWHVVGIDADVHRIAWACVCGGSVKEVGQFPRANSKGRIDRGYVTGLMGLMKAAQLSGAQVWLEGIFLPEKGTSTRRNVEGFRRMAGVQGEIYLAGLQHGVPVDLVQPATWMRDLLGLKKGQGNPKAWSMDWAQRFWGRAMSSHEADAVCIALWGWAQRVEAEAGMLFRESG